MDSSDRYRRVMDVFDEVCDMPAGQRAEHLTRLCDDDADLRHEVESLLRADSAEHQLVKAAESGRGLEVLADGFDPDGDANQDTPERIGGYTIVREIGRGGMGIIYEAEQVSPQRKVALKVLRPGLIDRELLKRFQHEAHILGQLQHSGIAQIFEAGLAETPRGRQPFFVMELIGGTPLDRFANTNELNIKQRLELSARVCDAVQHAHQKGIIHRDLKPSNVLVAAPKDDTSPGTSTTRTSIADAIGQPKVLDFGIARVTDSDMQTITMQTEVGQLVGTLAYMSPEQVEGNSDDLDTRCDVYALGVMLYELLSGRRPHDLTGLPVAEAARRIREEDPPQLGAIDKRLRGDVETIVAKALEKDRERRYGSAAEMATDIRRFLNDQPIEARPASTFYQLGKFARRNKGLVVGVCAAILALSIGLVVTAYSLKRANVATLRAQRESRRATEESEIAKKAKEDVELVSRFQGAMIESVKVREMGDLILREISDQVGPDDSELSMKDALKKVNPASLARSVVDGSMLSNASAAATEQFSTRPTLEADIRESLARSYIALAMYDQCLNEAQQALALRRKYLGDDHLDTIRMIGFVGYINFSMGRADEAESYLAEELRRLHAQLPENHELTLEARDRMALILSKQGKLDESLELAEAIVADAESVFPADDEKLLGYRQHLVMLYTEKERFEDALALSRILLKTYRGKFGDDSTRTLLCWSHLAGTLGRLGRMDEAEREYSEVLERTEKLLGKYDPRTIRMLHNVAAIRTAIARDARARDTVVELLERQRKALPPDDPSIAESLDVLQWFETTSKPIENRPGQD